MNTKLEEIQKSLDMYLETKRQIFPRFYFLSNDDLLEILGQSKNPEAVQAHLKKCFDNIKSLKMSKVRGTVMNSGPQVVYLCWLYACVLCICSTLLGYYINIISCFVEGSRMAPTVPFPCLLCT